MNPVNFVGATDHYGPPANWNPETDGECAVLAVQVVADPYVRCISVWMPTDEERADIAAGKPITLSIYSSQPVVAVYVTDVEVLPAPTNEGGTA